MTPYRDATMAEIDTAMDQAWKAFAIYRKVPLKQINVHKTVLNDGNQLPRNRQRDLKSVPADRPRGHVARSLARLRTEHRVLLLE